MCGRRGEKRLRAASRRRRLARHGARRRNPRKPPQLAAHRPRRPSTSLLRIPVIGPIARGTQRLNYSLRGSMEPRIEQFSR